jgi:hypothetical protein
MILIYMHSQIINQFFNSNYSYLLMISNKYLKRYNFKSYKSDEMLSDFYIHILANEKRIMKYEKVIREGNGLRYLISSIKKKSYMHKKFIDDAPHQKQMFYTDYEFTDVEDKEEINEEFYLTLEDIIKVGEDISKRDNNYWKFEYWKDYYLSGYTYKMLSEKYDLTISPIWGIVHKYNDLMKKELK